MVHGMMTFSSDMGDWPLVDNASKPMKSRYHINVFEKKKAYGRVQRLQNLAPASEDSTPRCARCGTVHPYLL